MEGQAERARRRPRDPPGWGSFWRAGLLAASILSSAFLLTQAQSPTTDYNISIFMNPPEALEGQEINLTLKHAPVTFFVCNWYRETENKENLIVTAYLPPLDGHTLGPAYTKRETPGFGCSLLIVNLHPNDTGNYIVTKSGPSVSGRGLVNIQVLGAVYKVTITGPSHAIENHPVTLRCSSLGSNVSYSWLKGGQLIEAGGNTLLESNSQTLTLLSTSRSDAASYTCSGENSFSSNNSEPHWLEIFYGPDHPVINPLQQIYNELSILILFCSAISNPPAKFSWYLNGELLEHQNNSHLIRRLSLNNAGNYTCNVTNEESGLFNYTILEISILEAIKNITISHPGKIFETSTTHLNCTASGSNVSYYWLKGNQSLEVAEHISLSSNGQNLTLNPTKRQDSNRYTCFGNNSFSSNFTSYTLNVLYGPDAPVISPSVQFYAESSNLTLSCQADSNPAANYTWYFKSSAYPGKTFQIFNLSSVHNGSYKCEAYNSETKLSRSKIQPVCVLETLSDPVLWSSASLVSEEENVTLHCRTSNSSKVTVTWSKDGAPVSVKAELSDQNRTLVLPKFTQDYAGTYTCTARNPVSSATSNPTKIAMAYGPMAAKLNQSGAIVQPLGSALVLLCTADSMPPAEFRWFFNNTAKNEMEDTLRVHLVAWDDEGNYTCQARNSFTGHTASASVYVKLTGESSEPPGLSVGAIVGIVIGSVAGAVLCVGVVYFLFTKASCWRTEQHASNGNIPSAPGHNQATDTKSKPGEEDIQYSTLAFGTNNASQPTSGLTRPLDSATIYSEIKKK